MAAYKCPNITSPEWIKLVETVGEESAWLIYHKNQDIPKIVDNIEQELLNRNLIDNEGRLVPKIKDISDKLNKEYLNIEFTANKVGNKFQHSYTAIPLLSKEQYQEMFDAALGITKPVREDYLISEDTYEEVVDDEAPTIGLTTKATELLDSHLKEVKAVLSQLQTTNENLPFNNNLANAYVTYEKELGDALKGRIALGKVLSSIPISKVTPEVADLIGKVFYTVVPEYSLMTFIKNYGLEELTVTEEGKVVSFSELVTNFLNYSPTRNESAIYKRQQNIVNDVSEYIRKKINPEGLMSSIDRVVSTVNNYNNTRTLEVKDSRFNNPKERFNSRLSETLISFLEGLNIQVDFDADEILKDIRFKETPLAALDVIQKYLALSSDATEKELVIQSAAAIYNFLGRKSALRVTLWKSVKSWHKYDQIYNKYKDINQEVLEDQDIINPTFNAFAHKQAVIYMIADALEQGIDRNFKPLNLANEDVSMAYFSDRNYKNKYEKNAIISLFNKIWNYVQENILNNKLFEKKGAELRNIVMDIVNDVYKGDFKKFIRVYGPNEAGDIVNYETQEEYEVKGYEDTLNKDSFAKDIINKLFAAKFIDYRLSGSQAIRKFGTVLRSVNEDLHAIDGVITLDQFRKEENSYDFLSWIQTRGLGLSKDGKSKQFMQEIMPFLENQSWYANLKNMFPSWKLTRAFIGRDHKNGESVTIQGYVEHPTETEIIDDVVVPKRYILDFFLRTDEGNYPEQFDNYWKDWQQIFEAKVNMGRAKDLNDLIYFIPNKEDKYKFKNKGFRYFVFSDESIPLDSARKVDEALDVSEQPVSKVDSDILNSEAFKKFNAENTFTTLEENLEYYKMCKL